MLRAASSASSAFRVSVRASTLAHVKSVGAYAVQSTHQQMPARHSSSKSVKPSMANTLQLEDNTLLRRMAKKIFKSVPHSLLRSSGIVLLSQCAIDVNVEKFFKEFDLPDTFYSWFLVTELHVWMMSARLMAEDTKEGKIVRNAIIEAFWSDCDRRIKLVGIMSSKERTKNLCSLAEEFQAALCIYDYGLLSEDRDLANALWRRFFSLETPDAEKIERLVSYVRRTICALDNTDLNTLVVKKAFVWPNLTEDDKAQRA